MTSDLVRCRFAQRPLGRLSLWVFSIAHAAACLGAAETGYDFPIYKNTPPGKQLAGQHAPASTPALSPEEARKRFAVPEGFEMRLFASEPMVVNPVAMTWDERGRLWVIELYEYPLGVKPGEKPRDRIKVLEDTDNDGRADKVTVFADGFSLATGLLIGNGGVYLGQAPHLYFLEDTDNDGKADRKTIVKTGFGMEDRHELLNGFTWGPDGWLYMTHGVFTYSKVKDPSNPNDDGVVMTAALARFDPRSRRFEIFSEGTSNPWGVDFDARGQAFVSACVIDHLFHLSPAGLYQRQAGQPPFPYAYDLLPSIVDHRHHMAAYAGVQIYQGNQYPSEYQGAALMGNIHDNSIHWDRLTPAGSSYKASFVRDLVRANDGWFMPVSLQTGPDGALWIMDWYDRYPCYQNANADPAGVDRELGRIWRLVHVGNTPGKPLGSRPETGMDLAKMSSEALVPLLGHSNSWQRRTAQRVLSERGDTAFGPRSLHPDSTLLDLFRKSPDVTARLAALWTLHGTRLMDDAMLDEAAESKDSVLREWAARLTGERALPLGDALKRLEKLAQDPEPAVRAAVAVAARQFVSGSLTVDTPPLVPLSEVVTGGVLSQLFQSLEKQTDPNLSFLFWMALEPLVAYDAWHAADFFRTYKLKPGATSSFSESIFTKIMRRACDARDAARLSKVVKVLGLMEEEQARWIVAGLTGLIEGQRGKTLTVDAEARAVVSRLSASPVAQIATKAQQLGSLWGDAAALRANLERILLTSIPDAERIAGIKTLSTQRTEDVREGLLRVARSSGSDAVRVEAVRALGVVGHDVIGQRLLSQWEQSTPAVRRATAELMSTRDAWISQFLKACKSGAVKRGDVPPTVIRNLSTHRNDIVRLMAQEAFGKFNAAGADKLKLIADKRRIVVQGPIDLEAGHQVAKRACLICHLLHGEGGQVGPDLTGVGRSSLDALLHNVVNPNEIIGQGYENVELETKDGRILTGRMVENTNLRVRIMSAGGQEEVVGKSDIAALRVTQNSVMPEGLEQMPDAEFRNLIWYILAPPQDGKPLNDERKRELVNTGAEQASVSPSTDGEVLKDQAIRRGPQIWTQVSVDLSAYAGKRVVLRLENAANEWNSEFAYWSDLRLTSTDAPSAAKLP